MMQYFVLSMAYSWHGKRKGKKKTSGLSMNILGLGDKLPVQRSLLKNGMDKLLPALRILGGLYNFAIMQLCYDTFWHIAEVKVIKSK